MLKATIDNVHSDKRDISLIQPFPWSVNIKQADLNYVEDNHIYWSFAQEDIYQIEPFLWSVNIKQADLNYVEDHHRYWSFAQDGYITNSAISLVSEY